MPDDGALIGALIDQLPPDAKADVEVQHVVAAAVAATRAAMAAPGPSPVGVQRVDEYVSPGVYTTSFEVYDRRKPTGQRIVKTVAAEEPAQFAIDEAYAAARAAAIKIAPIEGGAYVYAAVDSDEYWHDTDAEQLANAALYNVISGCAVTADAANLTADLAAGAVTHNGTPIEVAAATDAYTIVADGSNERWAALTVGSAGTAVLVSGDAAASSSVEPTKPEIGDRVLVALYKVQAGQTIAANAEYRLDKRVPHPGGLIGFSNTATSTTSTSAVDLLTISKLGFDDSIPITTPLTIQFSMRKTAAAANLVRFGVKINSTVVLEVTNIVAWSSSATQRAEEGVAELHILPRSSANYLNGFWTFGFWRVSSDGSSATAAAVGNATLNALMPNAAITSIVIRAINDTASNAAEVKGVFVWARA